MFIFFATMVIDLAWLAVCAHCRTME